MSGDHDTATEEIEVPRTDLHTADDVIATLTGDGWDRADVLAVIDTLIDAGLEVQAEDVVLITDGEIALVVEQLRSSEPDDADTADDAEEPRAAVIESPRFGAIEGAYTGTSDDVAGRWYIVDREGDAIDKRGRGWRTRAEAIDALTERLDAIDAWTGDPHRNA